MARKSYREMILLPTFEERFRYLKLGGVVAYETFGSDRYLNQKFYQSVEWKQFRRDVLVRDMGCDLAMGDRPIYGKVIIHHMNPIKVQDLKENDLKSLMNLDEVVCTSMLTHDAIHYGDESLLMPSEPITRYPNDHIPWR